MDWPSLLQAIDATGPETILLTHGYTAVVAHWLQSRGKDARVIATRYTGERDDASVEPPHSTDPTDPQAST